MYFKKINIFDWLSSSTAHDLSQSRSTTKCQILLSIYSNPLFALFAKKIRNFIINCDRDRDKFVGHYPDRDQSNKIRSIKLKSSPK